MPVDNPDDKPSLEDVLREALRKIAAEPKEKKDADIKPEHEFWDTYLRFAAEEDKHLPGSWEANTGSVLTFTGLFAATVAAFLIESYKSLSPDTGDQTVMLLQQLVAATANASTDTPVIINNPEPFQVTAGAIIVNTLWFSSLLIALASALLSTLIQEWARDYKRDIDRRRTLDETSRNRAFNHIYLRMGIDRYGMDQVVYWSTVLVHISVMLFAVGLVLFLFPIDPIVAGVVAGTVGVFGLIYTAASVQPVFDTSCPYWTPVTPVMFRVAWMIIILFWTHFGPVLDRLVRDPVEPFMESTLLRHLSSRFGGSYDEFLTLERFKFVWERISRHMLDKHLVEPERFSGLLRGLISARSFYNGQPYDLVCSDKAFLLKLYSHLYQRIDPDGGLIRDPVVFDAVEVLSERMFAQILAHPDEEDMTQNVENFFQIFFVVSMLIWEGKDETDKVLGQICLARVRSWLIQYAKDAQAVPSFTLTEKNIDDVDVFQQNFDRNNYRTKEEFQRATEIFRNPTALLLIFRSYTSDNAFYNWRMGRDPHLVPLHDADCCRSWQHLLSPEGLAHETALNHLTFISILLESPASVRIDMPDPFFLYEYFWDDDDIEKRPPSAEFIRVLRAAGLHEWLKPGSDFSSGSYPNPTNFSIRGEPLEQRRIFGHLYALAQRVDMEAYHQSHPDGPLSTSLVHTSHVESMPPIPSENLNRSLSNLETVDAPAFSEPALPAVVADNGPGISRIFELEDVTVARDRSEDA